MVPRHKLRLYHIVKRGSVRVCTAWQDTSSSRLRTNFPSRLVLKTNKTTWLTAAPTSASSCRKPEEQLNWAEGEAHTSTSGINQLLGAFWDWARGGAKDIHWTLKLKFLLAANTTEQNNSNWYKTIRTLLSKHLEFDLFYGFSLHFTIFHFRQNILFVLLEGGKTLKRVLGDRMELSWHWVQSVKTLLKKYVSHSQTDCHHQY